MKHAIVTSIVIALLLPSANNAFAQEEEQWLRIPYRVTVSIDAGIGMPMNPSAFSDLWNTSLPATFSVGVVTIPQIEVKAWIMYASWSISGIPAQNATGIVGVYEVTGGTVNTTLYGGSVKFIPLPNSRITPIVEVGGGFFQATGEDLEVGEVLTNTMEDANGPAFLVGAGMEYGINERWNTYAKFNYSLGFSDKFAPGNLVLGPDSPRVEGGDLQLTSIIIGISLKI